MCREAGSTAYLSMAAEMPCADPLRHDSVGRMRAVRFIWVALDARYAEWRGPASIERRQRARLARLVRHARSASPFYRRLYRGLPSGVTDPSRLPPVRKRDLMEHFDEWVTDPDITLESLRRDFLSDPSLLGSPYLGRYTVFTTSGTTGEPAVLIHDAESYAVQGVVGRRHEPGMLARWSVVAAVLRRGLRAAALFVVGGHFAGPVMVARARSRGPLMERSVRTFAVTRPLPELVAELNEWQPTVLEGYPSVVRLLAAEQRAARLRIRPFLAILTGENLSRDARAEIEAVFGCIVVDRYACSEAPGVVAPCRLGSFHVNSDWYLLEPVDEHDRACPPGVVSHTVLVTNLANRVQPVIRYDLGDRVELVEAPCPCGSPLPVVRVEGRAADVVVFEAPDGTPVPVPPLALATVIEGTPGVRSCQAIRTGPRSLTVRIEAETGSDLGVVWTGVDERLATFVASHGMAPLSVEHAPGPPRPDPGSGKLRQVYSA